MARGDETREARPTMGRFESWANHILRQPLALLLALACARQIAVPYAGLIHDAQLYAFQTVQRSTGLFDGDLFFAYGSQDQFSAFSWLAAPFVEVLGLETGFYVLFLISSMAFLWAQVRLVVRIVPQKQVALASLVTLTVADLPYGGWGIFQVHEPFLTPRLMACALGLVALDAYVSGHRWRPWCFAAGATCLHPLMAAGVIAVLFGCRIFANHFWRAALVGLAATLLSIPFLAFAARMDDEWLQIVRQISPHCFPMDWRWTDGVHAVLCSIVCLSGARELTGRARLVIAWIVVVAWAGLILALFAPYWPVALIIQGQPMRALWLLEFFSVPMALLVSWRLWQSELSLHKALGLGLTIWALRLRTVESWPDPWFWTSAAAFALLFSLGVRFTSRRSPSTSVWIPIAAGMGMSILIDAFQSWTAILSQWGSLRVVAEPLNIVSFGARSGGSVLPIVVALAVLTMLWRRGPARGNAMRAAACLAVLIAAMVAYRATRRPSLDRDSLDLVQRAADRLANGAGFRPTVYWPTDIRNVWFELGAKSYFHFVQLQGAVFDRRTALEARRRADRVRAFEMDRANSQPAVGATWNRLGRFMGSLDLGRLPQAHDLFSLCEDPFLDLVILSKSVPGVPTITNGRVWIYDCSAIRSTRGSPPSDVVAGKSLR